MDYKQPLKWGLVGAIAGSAIAVLAMYPHLETSNVAGQFQEAHDSPLAPAKVFPNMTITWTGQGVFKVGTEAPTGQYLITGDSGTFGCSYARLKKNDIKSTSLIEAGVLNKGQNATVRVASTDNYFKLGGPCAITWVGR